MADDPLSPYCRPPWPSSGLALGVRQNGYYPAKTRQARGPDVRVCSAGHMHIHMHTHKQLTQFHVAGNCQTTVVLCRAVLCCTVLCCDVAASAFCIAGLSIFQRGRAASWPPILFLTSHSIFSCYCIPAPSSSLCLARSACLSACRLVHQVRKCESSRPEDELIQQWQAVGKKACQSGPAVPQLPPSSWPCLMRP